MNLPSTTSVERPPRSRRLAVKLGWLFGIPMVVLVAGELLLHRAWAASGHPFSPESARARMVGTSRFVSASMIDAPFKPKVDDATQARDRYSHRGFIHPYFGWDIDAPNREYAAQLRQLGGRSGDEHLDILVLGGSVAASFPACARAELAKVLGADQRFAGRPVRVLNQAVAAYKQPQQLMRLAYLFTLGYTPDIVINLDGFNEVAVARHNAVANLYPLFPAASKWARWLEPDETLDATAELRAMQLSAQHELQRALDWGLDRSALTAELGLWWLQRIRNQGMRAYGRLVQLGLGRAGTSAWRGPNYPRGTALMELLVGAWANSSWAIQGLCETNGAFYLHVLQPTLHDEGSKPLTQSERDGSDCSEAWLKGTQLGYPMLRAAGANLEQAGVAFLDASDVFAEHTGELYFDACHFVCEGHEILARAIGEELLERLPNDGWPTPAGGIHQRFIQRD